MSFQAKRREQKHIEVVYVDDSEVKSILPVAELKLKMDDKKARRRSTAKEKSENLGSSMKTQIKRERLDCPEKSNDEDDDDDDYVMKFQIKPAALFEEGDVSGKEMFGFHTPKKRNAMIEKAKLSASKTTPNSIKHSPKISNSPRTPKAVSFTPSSRRSILVNKDIQSGGYSSPGCFKLSKTMSHDDKSSGKNSSSRSRRSIVWNNENIKETSSPRSKTGLKQQICDEKKSIPSTPYSLRTRLKSKIAAKVKQEDSEESDIDLASSDDSDQYKNSDSSSESEDTDKEDEENNGKKLNRDYSDSTRKRGRDLTYAISVDDYFSSTSSKKNKTSNHTLSKLKSPRIDEEKLAKLLGSSNSQSSHKVALQSLQKDCTLQHTFDRWCFSIREGFSVLLYGLGSKKYILNEFHKRVLAHEHVLVINGFFPGLSIKEMADSLAELLNIQDISTQLNEVVESVEINLARRNSPTIFIIVHNLDGVMLQSDKAQTFLSSLARIPKCHLLASIDHINAPLMWDDKKLSNFNFIWEDVTSYTPYLDETSFENSLLVKNTGGLVLSSLKNVYQSLTKNGKDIFKLLVEDHLANRKNKKYTGVGFSELYWKCRDNFLVSTDLALRSQLTEFLDHQILKWRKDSDHLFIPIDSTVLEQFGSRLSEQDI